MTRIFIYEYLCAQRADENSASARALRAEGRAMRDAVVEDFRAAGADVLTLGPDDYEKSEQIAFQRRAATANWSLVIAPEFDGILEQRCRWVTEAGSRLLGPSHEAVRLTSDKLRFGGYLATVGVPTPRSWAHPEQATGKSFPQIWKPRDGAGSLATVWVGSKDEVPAACAAVDAEGWRGELMGQEWIPGHSAGVALLVGPVECVALPPTWQDQSEDGRFKYQGGRLPIPARYAQRAIELAKRAVKCMPGLLGYVGVDVVLGEGSHNGRARDWVIEINPRLTTSYIGLRALSESNLAEAMLKLASGHAPPELKWRDGSVRFSTDGSVTVT